MTQDLPQKQEENGQLEWETYQMRPRCPIGVKPMWKAAQMFPSVRPRRRSVTGMCPASWKGVVLCHSV